MLCMSYFELHKIFSTFSPKFQQLWRTAFCLDIPASCFATRNLMAWCFRLSLAQIPATVGESLSPTVAGIWARWHLLTTANSLSWTETCLSHKIMVLTTRTWMSRWLTQLLARSIASSSGNPTRLSWVTANFLIKSWLLEMSTPSCCTVRLQTEKISKHSV